MSDTPSTEVQRPVPSTSSSSSTTTSTSAASKKLGGGGARLPTLNQLAARMTSNATAKGEVAPQPSIANASRPRLAAFASLRTGSQTSVNTTNSNTDSMAVNPPSTRSASPSEICARSGTPVPEGGDPLTEEGIDKLNQESVDATSSSTEGGSIPVILAPADQPKRKIGYKNIPSLDAITARIAKQRAMSLSVDGSPNPPEPEMIDDPKSPGVSIKAPEHPLQFSW